MRLAIIGLLCLTGCVLPVPHRRVHQFGVKGRIIDAKTSGPVANAALVAKDQPAKRCSSASDGSFVIPPVYGWHGACLLGPINLSLWPDWDVTEPSRAISVSANGYKPADVKVTSPRIDGAFLSAGEIRLSPMRSTTNFKPAGPQH
jgi:hypothetical protein